MSYAKQPRTMPIKPKIVLPLRGQCGELQQTPVGYVSTPYGQSPIIMTPVVSEGSVIYNKENNGFVFTQIRGIKDFTKTGLSLGERSAFWLYEKVRKTTNGYCNFLNFSKLVKCHVNIKQMWVEILSNQWFIVN